MDDKTEIYFKTMFAMQWRIKNIPKEYLKDIGDFIKINLVHPVGEARDIQYLALIEKEAIDAKLFDKYQKDVLNNAAITHYAYLAWEKEIEIFKRKRDRMERLFRKVGDIGIDDKDAGKSLHALITELLER